MFFIESKEQHNCPTCTGNLVGYGIINRHIKDENSQKVWYKISRKKCSDCNKTHNMIPDFMLPYKHYKAEIIQEVIDNEEEAKTNVKTETKTDSCPVNDKNEVNKDVGMYIAAEESTIYRWKKWFRDMQEKLNSNLKAIWQVNKRLFFPLLDNTISLLTEFRKSGGNWLAKTIGLTINAGYPAYTQFAYST